jgi:hypothetical protein
MRSGCAVLLFLWASVSFAEPYSPSQLYIVLAPVSDVGARLDPALLRLLEEGMRERLGAMGGVLARAEDKSKSAVLIRGKHHKRYYVQVRVERSSDRGLKMSLLCFTYPGRSLLGEVNVQARGGQPAALIRALAPKAIDEAADTFSWNS